jgi:predicted O-methyltransferase YrrM
MLSSETGHPNTMVEALGRYATRNNATGTDKTTSHSYGELYTRLFAPYRTSAKRVLEIGVYSGASVLAFADFFQGAFIDGIDVTLQNVTFGLGHPRIAYHEVDGTSPDALVKLGSSVVYDVILDDASHQPDHQVASLDVFAPTLSAGGIYVIEDIDGAHAPDLYGRLGLVSARHGLTMEWHDLRSVKGQFDDVVAVFRKP